MRIPNSKECLTWDLPKTNKKLTNYTQKSQNKGATANVYIYSHPQTAHPFTRLCEWYVLIQSIYPNCILPNAKPLTAKPFLSTWRYGPYKPPPPPPPPRVALLLCHTQLLRARRCGKFIIYMV